MTSCVEPPAAPAPPEGKSLRGEAVGGAVWTIVGQASQRGFQLVSNLVLARLLFPEAFGLMAYVQVVLMGLGMFSDMGTSASVIRDKRGAEPVFLNTAWTIQCVRGVGLWAAAALLAWPMAKFYGQPELLYLIPVVGFREVILGFESRAAILLQRNVNLRPLVVRDVLSQCIGFAVTVSLALAWRSVWVLVIGALTQGLVKLVSSYTWMPGPRPRFCWDREVAREIFRFGRWIFLSTAITFLLQQGDRLVLGKFMTAAELGSYTLAAVISRAMVEGLLVINKRVLFPVYAKVYRKDPHDLGRSVRKVRLRLLALCLPPMWALAVFGEQLIDVLYDDRYESAGWSLRVLACGTTAGVIALTAGTGALLAVGDSFRFMLLQVWRGVTLIGAMWIGGTLAGVPGVIVGVAASKALDYPCVAWATAKYGLWQPDIDVVAYGLSAAVIGGGWYWCP